MATPPAPLPTTTTQSLSGHHVAFTTPETTYGGRLRHRIELRGGVPLPCPTIWVGPTSSTLASLRPYLLPSALDPFAALAFTSRSAISAFAVALESNGSNSSPLSPNTITDNLFIIAALGCDADALDENLLSKLCYNFRKRIRVLVPDLPTPAGLVRSLGSGSGRQVLCPVPTVIDLEEPPVIPDFLAELRMSGWVPARVPAYETRWVGPHCVEKLVEEEVAPDAILFTSSAEVEGVVKGLKELGLDWEELRRMWPQMIVAAHGPVTAKGVVERFGIVVDVVGERFGSFDGVLDALAARLHQN